MHWDGRVLPVRVAGKCGATVADIVDGMRWAGGLPVVGVPANRNPARVINISFGGEAACGPAYQTAVDELRAAGVVVVAAAGNGGATPTRPANCAGVVGVVALNRDGFKTTYSSFGAALAASGLATVGGDDTGGAWGAILADPGLLTLWNDGRTVPGAPSHAYHFGTSFSTPLVAGAAALMLSVNPALTADQLVQGLGASARPHVRSALIGVCSAANPGRCICTTDTCGRGILDVAQALAYAAAPLGYVPPAAIGELIDSPEVAAAVALGPDRAGVPIPVDSGGGGAFAPVWALGLLAAAAALWRLRGRD
jgi:serine protease